LSATIHQDFPSIVTDISRADSLNNALSALYGIILSKFTKLNINPMVNLYGLDHQTLV